MSTIYATLKKDHDRHRKLLATIADTQGDSEKRREAWDQFFHDVSAHAAAEEETFYSRLIADEEGQPEARHSVAEHKEIDDMLEELNEIEFSSPAWLPKFKEMRHRYEHHIEEEEEDIFPVAEDVLGKDGNESFGAAFEKRKDAELKLVDEKAEEKLEE